MIMDRLYGGVCYAGIDVDPELKYPKGKLDYSHYQGFPLWGVEGGSPPPQNPIPYSPQFSRTINFRADLREN